MYLIGTLIYLSVSHLTVKCDILCEAANLFEPSWKTANAETWWP